MFPMPAWEGKAMEEQLRKKPVRDQKPLQKFSLAPAVGKQKV